jgi:hypothetical protein
MLVCTKIPCDSIKHNTNKKRVKMLKDGLFLKKICFERVWFSDKAYLDLIGICALQCISGHNLSMLCTLLHYFYFIIFMGHSIAQTIC